MGGGVDRISREWSCMAVMSAFDFQFADGCFGDYSVTLLMLLLILQFDGSLYALGH